MITCTCGVRVGNGPSSFTGGTSRWLRARSPDAHTLHSYSCVMYIYRFTGGIPDDSPTDFRKRDAGFVPIFFARSFVWVGPGLKVNSFPKLSPHAARGWPANQSQHCQRVTHQHTHTFLPAKRNGAVLRRRCIKGRRPSR